MHKSLTTINNTTVLTPPNKKTQTTEFESACLILQNKSDNYTVFVDTSLGKGDSGCFAARSDHAGFSISQNKNSKH